MKRFLFDTHGLVFWANRESVSNRFLKFFDEEAAQGRLYATSVSFWEVGLLARKGRIAFKDVSSWMDDLFTNTPLQLLEPTAAEMIHSTNFPFHHRDPFDRLLIAQAIQHNLVLVTRDRVIKKYAVETYWLR